MNQHCELIKKYSLRRLLLILLLLFSHSLREAVLAASLFRLRRYRREPCPSRLQLISSALFILAVTVILVVGLETATVQWYAFGVVLVLAIST